MNGLNVFYYLPILRLKLLSDFDFVMNSFISFRHLRNNNIYNNAYDIRVH